jgi:hypothetical protein
MFRFAVAWERRFGEPCYLDGLTVAWVDSLAPRAGRATAPYHIDLNSDDGTISGSEIEHELVHVCLWRSVGDPDANHHDAPGPWSRSHDEIEDAVEKEIERDGL